MNRPAHLPDREEMMTIVLDLLRAWSLVSHAGQAQTRSGAALVIKLEGLLAEASAAHRRRDPFQISLHGKKAGRMTRREFKRVKAGAELVRWIKERGRKRPGDEELEDLRNAMMQHHGIDLSIASLRDAFRKFEQRNIVSPMRLASAVLFSDRGPNALSAAMRRAGQLEKAVLRRSKDDREMLLRAFWGGDPVEVLVGVFELFRLHAQPGPLQTLYAEFLTSVAGTLMENQAALHPVRRVERSASRMKKEFFDVVVETKAVLSDVLKLTQEADLTRRRSKVRTRQKKPRSPRR